MQLAQLSARGSYMIIFWFRALIHRLLRLPLRSGLFPNLERAHMLR